MDIYIYTYANICTYTYMYIYMYMHTGIYISPQLVHARLSNGVTTFLPWKLLRTYLESCVTTYRLRNPIKSTLSHDAVAAVVLYKHHLIIRVGAALIQFVHGSRSHFANGGYPSQKCNFAIFARISN